MKQQSFLALLYNGKLGVTDVVVYFQIIRLSQHSITSTNAIWFWQLHIKSHHILVPRLGSVLHKLPKMISHAVPSISCQCLYCVLSKWKPQIVLSLRTLWLLRAYCPWIDHFGREWGRSLTFVTCWQRRTYPFVSIQQSMSWRAAMELMGGGAYIWD